jgi:hypothetical protein
MVESLFKWKHYTIMAMPVGLLVGCLCVGYELFVKYQ